jgi:hypothetical protein
MVRKKRCERGDPQFAAAVTAYREWEAAQDYNGGSAANELAVEALVTTLLGGTLRLGESRAKVGSKELSEIFE